MGGGDNERTHPEMAITTMASKDTAVEVVSKEQYEDVVRQLEERYEDVVRQLAEAKKNAERLQKQVDQCVDRDGIRFPDEMTNGTRALECPLAIMTDSYKATHCWVYPEARRMVAYGEFRSPFKGLGVVDDRFVFYGMRHCIENFVSRRWTTRDIEAACDFYRTHNAGGTPYPFPKDLFLKFIHENDGYFPVVIRALPEGSVAHVRTPVFTITAENEYARLVTFLETILDHVWYGSSVATLSRFVRDVIHEAFVKSVDEEFHWLEDSRLHDFGFRGCTCPEQSVVGGAAHLLNFDGSDTMSACYHVQYHLNNGKPVGTSIPATEHSVMTAWESEEAAMRNEIEHYGSGLFACVMDSYDYDHALNVVLPRVAGAVIQKGGTIVLRPDSGDPCESVLKGLEAAEREFGVTINRKGFKCLNNSAVIQGDGVDYDSIKTILEAVLQRGFAASNVAFGMGGGLLQKMNRDTMSFACKLSHIVDMDGTDRDVMKTPKTASAKISLPGDLFVSREGGVPKVYPAEDAACARMESALKVVYNKGPVPDAFDDFDACRARVREQWPLTPQRGSPISAPLQAKVDRILGERRCASERGMEVEWAPASPASSSPASP